MKLTKRVVFDSHAILKYLQEEPGFEQVKALLHQADKGSLTTFINRVNLGEVYYQIIRRKGIKYAGDFLSIFSAFPIVIVSADDLVVPAAEIKAQYAISYADCFAAATAIREKASIITGDPEFKKIETIVSVQWI